MADTTPLAPTDAEIVALMGDPRYSTIGAADLRDTLINIAREIEALKRECGMDPESPIAIQNGRYMALSYKVRALAAGQATAAQQGVAYAALPEPITYQIAVLKACEHGDALVGWRVEPSRQSFDASMRPKRKLYTEGDMHDFADRTHALRASHGQAPAQADPADIIAGALQISRGHAYELMRGAVEQAAPAYKDSTPELHIGDSAFESWYSTYSPVHKSDKQRARDAYAAGMGDPLVTASPAAVAGPSGYGPKVTVKRRCSDCKACNSESYAVQGDSGHYVYCEHPSLPERKYIGDTRWDTPGWCPAAAPTTQPAPNEDEVISREQWIEQAMRVYLIAGDTEQQAEECAKYLWGELDMDDLADPYDAAMSDVEGRGVDISKDALDAARYRFLRNKSTVLHNTAWLGGATAVQRDVDFLRRDDALAALDAAIDAARAAQEGKSHDN